MPLDMDNIISIVASINLVRPDAWDFIRTYYTNLSTDSKEYFKRKLVNDCFNRTHGVYLIGFGIPLGSETDYMVHYADEIITITYQKEVVFTC